MKRRSLKSRMLAFLLVLCMLVGLTPVYAVSVGESVTGHRIDPQNANTVDGYVHIDFTPTESGHYFLVNSPSYPTLEACTDHGAAPASKFDFDDDEGWGFVYELTANTTYCFKVQTTDTYDVNIKKVSVAQDFEIPATMTGYAGTVHWMPINFDGALSTEIATNAPNVVDISAGGNAREHRLDFVAPGTATITVTSHTGITKTCVVTVKAPETIKAGETKTVYIDPYSTAVFEFIPDENGTYTLYTSDDYETYWVDFQIDGVSSNMWQQNGHRGMSAFDLVAGTTYTWEVYTYSHHADVPLTLAKADTMTGLTLEQAAVTGFVGSEVTVNAVIAPNLGVDRTVTWSSNNPSVAEVVATSLTSCNVRLNGVGAADITASWKDGNGVTQTATCQVTASMPETIAVGDTKTVNLALGESVTYSLTAGANGGAYLLNIPSGQDFSLETDGPINEHCEYYTDDELCHIFKLDPNVTLNITLGTNNAPLNTTVSLEEAVLATDLSFPDGTTIELMEGEGIRVPVELVGGNYLSWWSHDSSDWDVVSFGSISGSSFVLQGINPGTATVTVQSGNITKTLNVTVKSYAATVNDKWVGTMSDWEHLEFAYTPDADGYYFIHYRNLGTRVIPELGTTEPVSDFDYNMNGYEGTVFELKAGETYNFMTEEYIYGDYAVYLTPVQLATSWSIPATLSGAVDEELWLHITANGAMGPIYATSDGDIVRVGGSNVNGATIFLIAEGTADIIVTDQLGNEQRCTVTVSGKLPTQTFDGWKEMGLAAGESVTYYYTPNESGLHWIFSELNYGLGISLTENGAPVDCEYVFNRSDLKGKVYDLTANTTYELTFTSDVSMSTFIQAMRVEEAINLYLNTGYIDAGIGEEIWINYWLEGANGYEGVADITARSTNDAVVKILSCDGEVTSVQAVGEGEAEVYITANGVEYGPVPVTVGDQGGSTPAPNLIISSNNGSPFTLYTIDGASETVPGWFEGHIDTADGNTLAALGVTAIDLDTSTEFACWQVLRPVFDSDGAVIEWVPDADDQGNAIILPDKDLILTWPINDGVMFVADWVAGGNQDSGEGSGTPAPSSVGLAISGNGGTFDVVRTNETWEDVEHTREDMDVYVGNTLADFGITDITNIQFWDGKREFVGWQVYGFYTVTDEWSSYEEYGPLSDTLLTTQEILAYPAEESFIEFVAVWAGDDADYFTDVHFDAMGGTFPVTEFDYTENGPIAVGTVMIEYSGNGCMENGQSIKEQLDSSCYPVGDPVREGYTFEGWLAFYEDQYRHEMSDKLYTTEQVVSLPIPEENVQYLAKWKEISMEEYRFGDPYYPSDGKYVQHYTIANGGELEITITYDGGQDIFTDTYLSLHGESSMSFVEYTKEYGGIDFTFELADANNFEGWTTYSAEKIYIVEILKNDALNLPEGNFTVLKAADWEYPSDDGEELCYEMYLVLKNAKVYSTTMTPQEVQNLPGDTFYATVAQWHAESATLANVKAATCTAEGYTGDKVCANCGEVLKKGETIPKTAHEISPNLANVKAATCTAEGYTGDKVCVKCATVLVKGEAIAKLAHVASPNLVDVKSATHTEAGYTGDTVCVDCGAVIEAGKIIDKVTETVATPVVKEESKVSVDNQIEDVVAVISGKKAEETKIVLSEGTKEAIEEAVTKGDVVGADIVIEPINEENLSAAELESFKKEAAAIEDKAAGEIGDNAVVAEFIDISVIVKNRTTGEELGNISELDEPVAIEIHIPETLQAENREFYIVHYHDGKADLIKGDYKDGILTISTDKFSTYALVYADVAETPDPVVPNTGDQHHLVSFTTMLLISAAGIYLSLRKMRRV